MTLGGLLRPLLRKRIIQACARAFDGRVIAEIGVFKGQSARWIADAAPRSRLYLYDTFEGLPEPSQWDWHKKGEFLNRDIWKVQELIPHANILPGRFPTIVGPYPSFVHLDGDLYQTAKDALTTWPGAVFLVDDYGTTTCPGVKKAVNEIAKTLIIFPTEQALVLPIYWWEG